MMHQEKNKIIFGFVNTYIKGSNLPSPITYNFILEDSLSKYFIMSVLVIRHGHDVLYMGTV